MFSMTRREDEQLLAPLYEAIAEELARTKREWEAAGFAPLLDDSAAIGTLYRVPDAMASAHRVPLTAKLCVLGRDGDAVLFAPFSIDKPVEGGDLLIPPEKSPYGVRGTGALVIHLWARDRIAFAALSRLRQVGRCPAVVDERYPQVMAYGAPPYRRALCQAWRALAQELSE